MLDKELKEAGFKITHARKKIIELFENNYERHMSAEEIYKTLLEDKQEIGLATVYRVLTQFHTAGLVKRHNFSEGRFVFELNNVSHHDHLVCVQCGKIIEFFDAGIEASQLAVAKTHDFKMHDHEHTIYGVCRHCQTR